MRIRRFGIGLFVMAAIAGAAAPAAAQTGTPVDVSAGYQFLHIFADDNILSPAVNLPTGFAAGVTARVSPLFAVIGEYTANTSKSTGDKFSTFTGGVRGIGDVSDNVSAFVQALVGGARLNGETGMDYQPGIGFEFRTGSRITVRLQGDYLYTRIPNGLGTTIIYNSFRVATSLAFSFGSR